MKISLGQRLTGLLLVGIGIGYIGDLMGYWYFTVFFPGWWTLFFIVPSLWSMIQDGFRVWNITSLIFGVYFLAAANNWLDFRLSFGYIIPILLVIIGLKLVFSRGGGHYSEKKRKVYVNDEGFADIREEAIFTTHQLKEHGKINSVHVESVFSTIMIDLTDCDLHNLMFMTIETVFGTVNILIPEDVCPVVRAENVIGFCKYDNHPGSYDIPINVSNVFGKVQITRVSTHSYQEANFEDKL